MMYEEEENGDKYGALQKYFCTFSHFTTSIKTCYWNFR